MAYRTNALAITLEDMNRRIARLKLLVQQYRTASDTALSADQITDLWQLLKVERTGLVSAAAMPGIGVYAQNQVNDATYDVVAEFNAMVTAIDAATAWIEGNFPKDGSGFLLAHSFGPSSIAARSFASASLAGLKTQLDAIIARIS